MDRPDGLSRRGIAFWDHVTSHYALEVGELEMLRSIVGTISVIEWLEGEQDAGTRPQRLTVVREIRQQRLTLGRLLGQLGIPDDDGAPQMSGQARRAQHAANIRWANQRKVRGR